MSEYFYRIKKCVDKRVRSWSPEYRELVWMSLLRGRAILKTVHQLDGYWFFYGCMHHAKLQQAFYAVPELQELHNEVVDIIDYGCGQGMASIVLADFFNENNIFARIRQVLLLEPGVCALNAAGFYMHHIANKSHIIPVNKLMRDVCATDLNMPTGGVRIHLLSNILDMDVFEIDELCKKIMATLAGDNIFICVSPNFYMAQHRINQFFNCFNEKYGCYVYSERVSSIACIEKPNVKPWSRYEKCFKVKC